MAVILSGAADGVILIWLISWLVGNIPPFKSLSHSLNILLLRIIGLRRVGGAGRLRSS